MSTERRADAEGFRRGRRRYRIAVFAVVVVLGLACVGLGVGSSLQGPKLRGVAADASALVSAGTPQITLTADQALAPGAQIQVTPSTDFQVSQDGPRVTVRFAGPLDYHVRYDVSATVTSAQTGIGARLSTSLVTPDAEVYMLERSGSAATGDRLVSVSMNDPAAEKEVYSAPQILEYAAAGRQLAVLSASGTVETLATVVDGVTQPVPLIAGAHSDVRISDLGQIGWIQQTGARADGTAYDRNLVVTGSADRVGREVVGFSGQPLQVTDWRFVPGTTSVVVQDDSQNLFVVDTQGSADPVLLGRFGALEGFLSGSDDLAVANGDGSVTIVDLTTGGQRTVQPPAADAPAGSYPGVVALRSDSSALTSWNAYDGGPTGRQRTSTVAVVDATGTHPILGPTAGGSWVDRFCLSPNGRYASITVVAADGRLVGGTRPSVFSDAQTQFVDIATGRVVQTVPDAWDFDWCR